MNLRKFIDGFFSFESLTDGNLFNFPNENDSNWNKTVETYETDTHNFKKEIWKSVDGKSTMERVVSESKTKFKELTISELEEQMKNAAEKQDFETAAKLRDKIKSLQ